MILGFKKLFKLKYAKHVNLSRRIWKIFLRILTEFCGNSMARGGIFKFDTKQGKWILLEALPKHHF